MALDIWSREDIRNVILAANAAGTPAAEEVVAPDGDAFRAGYESALMAVAAAFEIPIVANGRLRSPGVVIPGGRLAVSYRAERALARLLQTREELNS